MKFKMAPNSLFAVLLRKPWWVSMAIGAVLTVVPVALLPTDLKAVGAMSGVAFFILGFVALARQWRAPSAQEIEAISQAAARMSWADFSAWLERAFVRDGFSVTRLEGGADLLLQRQGRKTLIAARRWKAARHGEDAIQALADALALHDAQDGIYLALGELTVNAQRLASAKSIGLMPAERLAQLLRGLSRPGR